MSTEWISSAEAARRLGISPATLYAYVSRGLLRSEGTSGRRERRYRADDVARLKRRRAVGRKAESIAANALDFGTPVLESSLTFIEGGRLHYRGHDAARLARSHSLEQVAQLLWECDDRPFDAGNLPAPSAALRTAWSATATLSTVDRCLILLPAAARWDHPSWVEDRAAMLETAVRILRLLTAAVTTEPASALPVHEQLAAAWQVPAGHVPLIRAALVLSADHEFNASTFAARVVASTGAHLYAATTAGLAAISGPRHGGLTRRVASLFAEVAAADDPESALVERAGGDARLPGFGHPLYPDGDVRAATLFALLREILPHSPELALAERLATIGARLARAEPNIDFAMATLERVLDLPKDSALALFLLGRTVGWIAHALEQAASGALIRPRARYIGPRPAA
ncbi:citrate/2-methylcitrate synthase [Enhydrobacter sp.]|jgi:citrate synthase|uniref:citrate/2-methylcitrate synthase n=1 Tax=Enhydrobacter sp. TaxID=1894999 RepID=UPI0026122C5F|nr:citrate/2-methylcitrate synthase [Enhydrobacter sp.]WIM14158.1 MAG: Citrate synthase (si) [Enhydrobacter sp.]